MFRNACFSLLMLVPAAFSQSAGVPVKMVVSVEPHKAKEAPRLTKDDVLVYQDKKRVQVTDWVPVRDLRSGVQLWILIDDRLDSEFGVQISDLKNFIERQPASTEIGIAYMRNGTAAATSKLTSDHAAASKALRLPVGMPGISASPYMSLGELIDKWPDGPQAREVLMITSGIDPYYGTGPNNPYLDRAMEKAERAGVVVHSIYYGNAGHLGHSYWQITWGQNYLSQIAEGTGGEFFWQGNSNPVSLAPFLKQLDERFGAQYLLTFLAIPQSKSGFEQIRLTTEVPQVTLVGQSKVYVSSGK